MIVGIRLQSHFGLEAIHKHCRHSRSLIRSPGFLFHNRRKRHQLLRRLDWQIRHPVLPDILQHTPMRLLHTLDNLLARHSSREPVRFRQQRPLAWNLLNLPRERRALEKPRNNLLGCQSFGDSEGVLHHFAFNDRVDYVGDARMFAELIFAVFELAARLEGDNATHENVRLVDHSLALQYVSDIADSLARAEY